MKAALYKRYGPPEVLRLVNIVKPVPKDNEVLVRMVASTVSAPDWRARKGDPLASRLFFGVFSRRFPILGYELAGDVEAVGRKVTRFKPGDAVFGMNIVDGKFVFRCHAEYVCVAETAIITRKPDTLGYAEAASLPSGSFTAYTCVQAAKLKPGHKVLINGASGSIGTAALQLANYYGAEVTAVCNTDKVEFLRSLGAVQVIDYSKQDFTQSDNRYDFILDAVGFSSFVKCRHLLTDTGAYLSTGLGSLWQNIYYGIKTRNSTGKRVLSFGGKPTPQDLEFFLQLIAQGKFKPVVDRCYLLEQIADAHRYVELGHKNGNVIISIRDE